MGNKIGDGFYVNNSEKREFRLLGLFLFWFVFFLLTGEKKSQKFEFREFAEFWLVKKRWFS